MPHNFNGRPPYIEHRKTELSNNLRSRALLLHKSKAAIKFSSQMQYHSCALFYRWTRNNTLQWNKPVIKEWFTCQRISQMHYCALGTCNCLHKKALWIMFKFLLWHCIYNSPLVHASHWVMNVHMWTGSNCALVKCGEMYMYAWVSPIDLDDKKREISSEVSLKGHLCHPRSVFSLLFIYVNSHVRCISSSSAVQSLSHSVGLATFLFSLS